VRRAYIAAGVVALAAVLLVLVSAAPSFETIVKDLAKALGKWTYALVGAMAFLETGAFVGFIAPGEFTVILGGVIAGEGTISIVPLIGLVWICAIAGDSLSFLIGHRVGRQFLLKHGQRLRITEERFGKVEDYFDRHGGKTIVIGRFIGFVRPLAPFIAGTSRMTYGRFIPYSILGTGLWGTTFCLLGYVFWRSFSQVSKVAGQATLALGVVALLAAGVVYARRRWPNLHLVWDRLTPGNLGIEFTTCLAAAVAGWYVFFLYAALFNGHPLRQAALDGTAFDIARDLANRAVIDVAKVVTDLGSLPVVGGLAAIAAVLLAMRRRALELLVLASGFGLTVAAVHIAKATIDRPRPAGSLVHTLGQSYPSGHAAYATMYIALAVIASRVLGRPAGRAVLVLSGIAVTVLIGATRVYLRAHYLSDVLGGFGLGLGILASCGAIALVIGHVRKNGGGGRPPS
jgi:undecaprenyl-diphosphatase